jgi:hypothetical protein
VTSKRNPNITAWVNGLPHPTTWDQEFDRLTDFLSQVVTHTLPWVCHAIEMLKRYCHPAWVGETDWSFIASQLESGVDSKWALSAVRADCPVSRANIVAFGRAIHQETKSDFAESLFPGDVSRDEAANWLGNLFVVVNSGQFGVQDPQESSEMISWLFDQLPVPGF